MRPERMEGTNARHLRRDSPLGFPCSNRWGSFGGRMDPRCGMLAALRRSWLGGLAGVGLLGCAAPSLSATNSTHWAFQPLTRVSVPRQAQAGEIDGFVSAALAKDRRAL